MKQQSRRNFLKYSSQALSTLFVNSLATGLPASFLLNPCRVAAQSVDQLRKTMIISTSRRGDPMNINCPGSYHPNVESNPSLSSSMGTFGNTETRAANVWCELPNALRQRLAFFHYAPRSAAHPEYLDKMAFHGSLNSRSGNGSEIFPSAIAQMTYQPGTYLQEEPVRLCDTELIFEGQVIQEVKPTDLRSLFEPADGALANLRSTRDAVLDSIYADMRVNGNSAQREFVDRYALSRTQSRDLSDTLGDYLEGIPTDEDDLNNARDQIIAAVALARIGVSPAITIDIPFGGDNHQDSDLQIEANETTSGVGLIGELWSMLNAAGLQDQVSFTAMNVFGRQPNRNSRGGRDHNQHHAVMLGFGPGVNGGVYGQINADGGVNPAGNINPERSLEAAGASMMRAFGCDEAEIMIRVSNSQIYAPFVNG